MNFDILNQVGQRIKCEIVGLFSDEINNRDYIIYTDGTRNNKGKLEVYASRYTKKNNSLVLSDIEEDSEWDLIDEYLLSIKKR